jgi:hypothetical protein
LKDFEAMRQVKQPVLYLFGWAARIGATAWLSTCREWVFGQEILADYRKREPGRNLLFTTWHRGLVYILYHYRFRDVVVMASTSSDGELAAHAAERFGWIPVRGSSSRRGSQALRQMEAMVKKGFSAGIVADAPRGPAHVAKMGVIVLAKHTGLPIMPVIWSAESCWRLNSWDRTIVPKPFSRVVGLFPPELIRVPAGADRNLCEHYRQKLDGLLNGMMYQVDHFFTQPGVDDPRQIEVPETFHPGHRLRR